MSSSNSTSIFNRQRLALIFGLVLSLLAGCANNPIDVGSPVAFRHRTGVFELQVPKSWQPAQDQVETESLAAFSDATGRSEIIAYAGLLDHQLTDDEGLEIVPGLIKNLLNDPPDLAITDKRRRSDGAFVVALAFTRNNIPRLGQAIFRDGGLALSGVIVSGPASDWSALLAGLQPYIDSFKLRPDVVQGTYFTPIENTHFALAVPADWERTALKAGTQVRSRSGQVTIIAAQEPLSGTLAAVALTAAAQKAAQAYIGQATVINSQVLPDGRTQLTLDGSTRRTIGYAEIKDGMLIMLLFEVPADRAAAYQPFIDFIYSTLVTGQA